MTGVLRQFAVWTMVALLAAFLAGAVVIPRLTGWVPLTVLSGSMEPAITTGSLVVIEPVDGVTDATGIGTGDVITFMPFPNDPTLVTHRVVSSSTRADGTVAFVTQGDANDAADPDPVFAQQVRGEVRYHLPYAGYLAGLLDAEQKRAGIILVAALCLGYAGVQTVRALRADPRPSTRETPALVGGDDTGADGTARDSENGTSVRRHR